MVKYWIVVDNDHQGPFTAEELAEMGVKGDTYAWHPGLPKWTPVSEIPELSELIAASTHETVSVEETVVEETAAPATDYQLTEETSVSFQPEAEPVRPAAPPTPPTSVATPPPAPAFMPAAQPHPYNEAQISEEQKCPPSYMAWSIITTILFFLPVGIAAIIYSSKVGGYWNMGDRAKARKASERAAWLSNIAFVVGLIWFPFSMVITSLF